MARRVLSLVLVALMLLSMSVVAISAYTVPDGFKVADTPGTDETGINGEVYGLIGDADTSDTVNVKDATAIQKNVASLLEFDSFQKVVADVDFDGRITVKDATAIQKWIASIPVDSPINHLIYVPEQAPTEAPTAAPTEAPTDAPTEAPTAAPTEAPTAAPTEAPDRKSVV